MLPSDRHHAPFPRACTMGAIGFFDMVDSAASAAGRIPETPTVRPDSPRNRSPGEGESVGIVASHAMSSAVKRTSALRGFVTALAKGRGQCVRGGPGIGKTTLWRAAIEEAETTGFAVLSARCVEAELPLAFVGLSDLVQDAFPAVADELTDHDRAALAVAVGLEAPRGATGCDRVYRARSRRSFGCSPRRPCSSPWMTSSGWTRRHDAPSPSLRAGSASAGRNPRHAARRRARSARLARAFDETRFVELRLEPLSLGALAHSDSGRLDVRIPRPALARVHEASGGNPMFALEFARSLSGGGARSHRCLPRVAARARPRADRGAAAGVRRLLALAAAAERPTPSLLAAIDRGIARGCWTSPSTREVVSVGDDGSSASATRCWPRQRTPRSSLAARALHAELAAAVGGRRGASRHLALASTSQTATWRQCWTRLRRAPMRAVRPRRRQPRAGGRRPDAAAEMSWRRATASSRRGSTSPMPARRPMRPVARRLLASRAQGRGVPARCLLRVWVGHDVEAAARQAGRGASNTRRRAAVRAECSWLSSAKASRRRRRGSESPRGRRRGRRGTDDAGASRVRARTAADRAPRSSGGPRRDLLDRALALAAVHGPPRGSDGAVPARRAAPARTAT